MPANRSRSYRLARDEEVAAEAVHGARKDMKKLRTVLRCCGTRWAISATGAGTRAFATTPAPSPRPRRGGEAGDARSAGRAFAGTAGGGGWSWRRTLDRDRVAATNAARDQPLVATATTQIEAGPEEIGSWSLKGNSWKTIGPGLTHSYRRGRQAMKVAEGGDEADFHEWRKRARTSATSCASSETPGQAPSERPQRRPTV